MAIERQYPTQDTTLESDASWDSLESQLNGIESDALFNVAAPAGVAVGTLGTVAVSAVFGSAVDLTPHAERREVLAEASIPSDDSWDTLETQIDGIESGALFLDRVDGAGAVVAITVSGIYGMAEAISQGSRGGRSYRWLMPIPAIPNPLGEYIWRREEEEVLFL